MKSKIISVIHSDDYFCMKEAAMEFFGFIPTGWTKSEDLHLVLYNDAS